MVINLRVSTAVSLMHSMFYLYSKKGSNLLKNTMSSEALYYMNLEFVKLNLDFLDFGVIFDTH